MSFVASSLLIVYEGSRSTEKEVLATGKADIRDKNNSASSNKGSSNVSNVDPDTDPESATADDCNSGSGHIQKRINDKPLSFNDEAIKKSRLNETVKGSPDYANDEISTEETNAGMCTNSSPATDLQVHLIDFAHVFPANDIDHNFLFGLQKLIFCLQTLVK